MRTVKFYTLGCKVNQYETQAMREQFLRAGLEETDDARADVCIINTCTVTHKADAESLSFIRKARRENVGAKIVVTGCLATLDKQKVKEAGGADVIVENDKKLSLANQVLRTYGGVSIGSHKLPFLTSGFKGHTRAFLKIQDGCNHFCSYCKVPLVRGRSRSRDKESILKEAGGIVAKGFKEIVLCGICLGAYGKDLKPRIDLADIMRELQALDGLVRIRLSSIEGSDVNTGLIQAMAGSEKLCPHLHIPLQSGDDRILKAMNRRYRADTFVKIIAKIKKNIPRVSITTDVLVGFPGETEKQFENTVKMIRAVVPLRTHIFPYSPRKGTAAALLPALPSQVVKQRCQYLQSVAGACTHKLLARQVGRRAKVLIEGKAKGGEHLWQGHTDNYVPVVVQAENNLAGALVTVRLEREDDSRVYGVVI